MDFETLLVDYDSCEKNHQLWVKLMFIFCSVNSGPIE